MVRQNLCGREWTGCNKLLPSGVNDEIEAFKSSSPEQALIARFCENDLVNGEGLRNTEYGKADTSRYNIAVCHDEAKVFLLSNHADFFELVAGHPSVFTSRVNKSLCNANGPVPVNVVLNPAAYIECAHVAILSHHHADSISFCP